MRLEFQCFRLFWIWPLLLLGCAGSPRPTSEVSALTPAPKPALLPKEEHFAELRQLTFGGENAEAYWSFDGKQLIFQAHRGGEGCDQIQAHAPSTRATQLPGLDRQGRDHVLVLPARRPRAHLCLDASGRRRCPPQPDRSRATSGRSTTLRHLQGDADGTDLTQLTRRPRATTPRHGLRQGRLDRLHLGARRRPRALPDGRGRQEREAPDEHARLRRRRVLQSPTARRSSGAPRGPDRAKELEDYKGCSRRAGAPLEARALRRQRRRQRSARRSPTSTPPRSRRSSTPRASASSSRPTTATPRAASSTSGPSTSTAPGSSASPTRPASTASRCSRPTASGSRSRRTARRQRAKRHQRLRGALGRAARAPERDAAADRIGQDVAWLADRGARGARPRHRGLEEAGALPRAALRASSGSSRAAMAAAIASASR